MKPKVLTTGAKLAIDGPGLEGVESFYTLGIIIDIKNLRGYKIHRLAPKQAKIRSVQTIVFSVVVHGVKPGQ